jgi:hypothetical protein
MRCGPMLRHGWMMLERAHLTSDKRRVLAGDVDSILALHSIGSHTSLWLVMNALDSQFLMDCESDVVAHSKFQIMR